MRRDKSTKVFYNASSYGGAEDRELRAFLKFVAENQAEDDFTRRLESHILHTIRSETFRREYMEMTLREHDLLYWGKQEGLEEGLAQGATQKAVEDAVTLIQKYNASPEDAARVMDAPLEAVLDKLNKVKAFANS